MDEYKVNLRRHNENKEVLHGTEEECKAFAMGYIYQELNEARTLNRYSVFVFPNDGDYSHVISVNKLKAADESEEEQS